MVVYVRNTNLKLILRGNSYRIAARNLICSLCTVLSLSTVLYSTLHTVQNKYFITGINLGNK